MFAAFVIAAAMATGFALARPDIAQKVLRGPLSSVGKRIFASQDRSAKPTIKPLAPTVSACVSSATGNWNDSTKWTGCAGAFPGAADDAYIGAGHTITLTASQSVNDMHVSTTGVLAIGANTLSVNGKLRAFTLAAPGTSSTSPGANSITSSGVGKLSFVGNSRTVFTAGEWGSATTGYTQDVSLNAGQTATGATGAKAAAWTVTSGTFDAGASTIAADTGAAGGNITISSGATLISARSAAGLAVFQRTSTTLGGTLTVNGTLQLSGTSPAIAMTSVVLSSGTVEYSRSATQNIGTVPSGTSQGGAAPLSTFNNLKFSGTGTKTLLLNITVNGTFTIGGDATVALALSTFTLTYGGSATLQYAGSATQTTASSEFPSSSGPANLTINNASGVTLHAARTINGTLTLTNGPLNNSTNNVSLGTGATISRDTGTLSATPTFGTTVKVSYVGTTGVTGGSEIPSSASVLSDLTMNKSGGVTLSTSPTVNGILTFTSGNITTGANTLTLASGAAVSGGSSASYVSGTLKKIAVPSPFIFPMGVTAVAGHAAGYTPLDLANAIGGGDLTVTTNHAVQTVLDTSKSLNEYWTLGSAGTLTADLMFHYLGTDVNGIEADYQMIVVDFGNATHYPVDLEHSVDTGAKTFSVTGVSSFSDWTVGEPAAPTAVKLTGFKAVQNNGEVRLQWQTGCEARNLGYNIYREQDGKRVAITPSLVAGSALVAGRQTRLGAGFSYTWYDAATADGGPATYWLEDLDLNGTRTLHGPIVPEVSYAKQKGRELRADLMSEVSRRTAPNAVQIKGWAGGAAGTTAGVAKQNNGDAMFADPSDIQHDLAGMAGVKLAIRNAGWYRVTQAELAAAGFTPADLNQLQLYRNGREVAISLSNNANSFTSGDYIEFYGEGLDSTTASAQTYYLVNGRGNGQRINAVSGNANPGDPSGPQSFAYTVERKERMIYFSGLRNGEGENFFGQIVSIDPVSANVQVDNLSGSSAQLEVVLQGVTNENHLVHVVCNGADLGTIDFANTDHPSRKFTVPAAVLHEGDNAVELTSLGSASDVSLIDAVRLTYNRSLVASDNALAFSVDSRNTRRVSGFTNPNVRVFDVSDTSTPVELKAAIAPDAGGYAALVEVKQASTLSQRTMLAIAGGQARQVDSIHANVPSALWSQNAGANYILITTGELKSAVEPLAQLRRSQGMTVAVVDVEDIYDEFSFGKHSPEAIRSFLQRATKSWKRQPHFVLFAGDASYDPKNYLGQGLNDLVPTKLIETSLTETASDDWLADFNNDGIADLAIGRLPVRTAAEASLMVNKIVSYENTAVDPSRSALLVADTNFEATNNTMKSLIPAGQPVQLINRSATDDAAAHSQVIAGLNQGPRLANYFGHGSNGIWSGAGLLSSNDAPSLTNTNRLSVFTMMTCFNGYFHDAYNESLSEALLKSQGGAVAVWASTSLTEPAGQNVIGAEFYRMLFGAQPVTLGDAARTAKSFTGDADVRRTWTLFGDPATRLR